MDGIRPLDVTPVDAARRFAASEDPELGVRVLAFVQIARARHPETTGDLSAFVAHLGELCGGEEDRLPGLVGPDLWLAHATVSGCPRALRCFERDVFGPRVSAMARRFDHALVEDVAQSLRLRLVAEAEPLLLAYRGRGSLQGWVSISLARALAKQQRRADRHRGADVSSLADALVADADLHAATERAEAKDALSRALRDAVEALDAPTRLLLKLHICDGLTIDDLARLHDIHRATASRRLERARRALADRTRGLLANTYGLQEREIDSLLRAARSSFESLMQTFLAS